MAIGVMRFKPLTMAQASPGYFGLQNLQQGLMQGLKMQQITEQQKLAQNVYDLKKQTLAQQLQDQATRRKMADQLFPVPEQVYLQQSGQTTAPLKPEDAVMQTEEQRQQMAKQLIAHQLASEGKTEQAARLQGLFPESKTAYERNAIAMGLKPGTTEFQQAIEAMSTNRLIPAKQKQAIYSALEADSLIQSVDEENGIEMMSSFLGAAGEARQLAAQAAGYFSGKTDPAYAYYKNFFNIKVPAITGSIRSNLGETATDSSNEKVENLVNVMKNSNTYEEAQSAWKQLKKIQKIAKSVAGLTPLEARKKVQEIEKMQPIAAQPRKSEPTRQGLLENYSDMVSAAQNNVPRGAESNQTQQYTREQIIAEKKRRASLKGGF